MKMVKIVPMHQPTCNCEYCKPSAKDNNDDIEVKETKLPTLGVNFPGVNIYTADDRIIPTDPDIYNSISSTANLAVSEIADYSDSVASEFYMNALGNAVASNICIIVDRFCMVFYNIYDVFRIDMNNMVPDFKVNKDFISREELANGIIMYINAPESDRKAYDFVSYTMAYLAKVYALIYNDARAQLNEYVVHLTNIDSIDSEDIKSSYDQLDDYFRKMCSNSTYEVARYCDCIRTGEALMLSADQVAEICKLQTNN